MLATQEELWNRLQKVFVLPKLLDQKGHFINLLQKHPPSKGRSAKRKKCFPFLFPIKCACTVDMVNTVDMIFTVDIIYTVDTFDTVDTDYAVCTIQTDCFGHQELENIVHDGQGGFIEFVLRTIGP